MSKILQEHNNRLEKLVSYMIKEGTEQTTTGNYIFDYYELPEQFEFICDNEELITDLLLEHNEVLDVDLHDKEFDIIFALDYCENAEQVEEQE